ncbi:hypothetical protein [Kushneria avicenniae]|uniref:hypothetical protein n=1 Tax=Kushneria avicenniae TaxID=402385 RepID=UPI000B7D8AF4|nr:hypothetical protein [Kushneria avicenniae]
MLYIHRELDSFKFFEKVYLQLSGANDHYKQKFRTSYYISDKAINSQEYREFELNTIEKHIDKFEAIYSDFDAETEESYKEFEQEMLGTLEEYKEYFNEYKRTKLALSRIKASSGKGI